MNRKSLKGKELLDSVASAGLLGAELQAKYVAGKLTTRYTELNHRCEVPNVGSQTGVALFNTVADPEFGLTNLKKECLIPNTFIMTRIRAKLAKVDNANADAITGAEIKAADFDNAILAFDGTKQIPALILNSEFELHIDDNKKMSFSARNFFLGAREKNQIEGSDADSIEMPNSILFLTAGQALQPKLNLPKGIVIPNTNVAQAGNVSYVWETCYLGFEVIEKK